MDKLGLLADSQHGFRKRRSTETQLIPFIDDLAKSLDVGEQIDCILLDFSKAFDKVPHSRRLLMKLQHYGVRGHLHDWITSFLLGRTQCVALDSQSSAATTVSSGVPQGTVLGSLLFLLFINDLPSVVSSTTRLYLGLNIHKSLSWDSHIDKITKKANSTLACLGCNVSRFPSTIKTQCYTTLVRLNMHPAYGTTAKKRASIRLRQYNVEPPGLPLEITSAQAVSQPCYSNSIGRHYKADEHMPRQ